MAISIPTTQTIKNTWLSLLETTLNQSSPLADRAFLRVLSSIAAGVFTTLYKFAAQETRECLAISASRDGLIKLGNEYNLPVKPAAATALTIMLPAVDGTIIPQTVDFVGDNNGVRYGLAANSNPATGGLITMSVTAKIAGATGNLSVSDTLTIGTQIAGAETTATVTAVTTTGADAEGTEAYRVRLLAVIRSPGGGGNAADYRNWANEVVGVENSYPYASKPGGGSPPDRTVYVEATTDIDPDGIAPSGLLTSVRNSITTDPVTGLSRQPLGMTDDTLYILSIYRTSFYVQINGLTVDASKLAQVQSDIEDALRAHFKGLAPFVDGLDPDFEKNDTITDASLSVTVQDIVHTAGGYFTGLGFGEAPGIFIGSYILGQGEHAKLADTGGIVYV